MVLYLNTSPYYYIHAFATSHEAEIGHADFGGFLGFLF